MAATPYVDQRANGRELDSPRAGGGAWKSLQHSFAAAALFLLFLTISFPSSSLSLAQGKQRLVGAAVENGSAGSDVPERNREAFPFSPFYVAL